MHLLKYFSCVDTNYVPLCTSTQNVGNWGFRKWLPREVFWFFSKSKRKDGKK